MAMKLEKVVPFGRSLDEYKNMFALSESDLDKKIIGMGDGPASFNAEMFALGKSVVSVDPLYIFQQRKSKGNSIRWFITSFLRSRPPPMTGSGLITAQRNI